MYRRITIRIPVALAATVSAGVFHALDPGSILTFGVAAMALAVLASLIGDATGQLSQRLGPGSTGVLQSAIGNLPEFFVALFALQAGLVTVVQTALVGSMLVNSLLVLGLAFLVGGWTHGRQRFDRRQPRMIATLTLLAVSALIVPTLAFELHTPAARFEHELGVASAVLLLIVFLASMPVSIGSDVELLVTPQQEAAWPVGLVIGTLVATGLAAAIVFDGESSWLEGLALIGLYGIVAMAFWWG